MVLKREREIVRDHTVTVVLYPDQPNPAAFGTHFDPIRARVKAVLNELFDDRARPLYDFTRGNLIRDERRQTFDSGQAQISHPQESE
jgi:hypothetical protein